MGGYFNNISNLPPGVSENDPTAPWNQPDPEECPDCEGTGFNNEAEECPKCEGEGYYWPEEDGEYDLSDEKHEAKHDK